MAGGSKPRPGQLSALGRCRSLGSAAPARAPSRTRVKLAIPNRNKVRIEFPVTHSKQGTEGLSNGNKLRECT